MSFFVGGMIAMRSTIVDIKNRTGLSLATISKYLNGGNVRPENKVKIDEAVKVLHYQVNENARSLVTNRTRVMGVIVFSVENHFVGTLLRYMGQFLREQGYAMMICDSNKSPEAERQNILSMVQKNVDGIVIMPVSEDQSVLKPAINAGIPVVCLDRTFDGSDFDSILVSNRETAKKLTEIPINHNHRHIAVLGSRHEFTGKERLYGFLDAMSEAGLSVPDEYMVVDDYMSIHSGYEGMNRLLSLSCPPTAVFLSNYEILIGAVMAINTSSFSYPEDFSLVGFDNLLITDVLRPQITVAIQPLEKLSSEAVRLLLKRTDESKERISSPKEHIVLDTAIRDYHSVKYLPA